MEALRQVRITHRGNYRHLLEDVLISYRLARMQGEEGFDESATASTSDSSDGSSDQETDTKAESEQSAQEDSEMGDEQGAKKL